MRLARDPVDPVPERVEPDRERPPRPGTVELSAALLIVGGVLGSIGALAASPVEPAALASVPLVTLLLNLAQIATGLLVRLGRIWLFAVNYVAVLAFLDLLASGASPTALMLGVAEVVALVILLAQRPWFDAMRAWRSPA